MFALPVVREAQVQMGRARQHRQLAAIRHAQAHCSHRKGSVHHKARENDDNSSGAMKGGSAGDHSTQRRHRH